MGLASEAGSGSTVKRGKKQHHSSRILPCQFIRDEEFLQVEYYRGCVHAQSRPTLRLPSNPWTEAHQVPLSVEFCKQEYWKIHG